MAGTGKEDKTDKKRKSSEKEEDDGMNADGDGFADSNDGTNEGTEDGTPSPDAVSTASPSTVMSSASTTEMSDIMKLLLEQKATGAQDRATGALERLADREWQFNSDKTAFENKVAVGGLVTDIKGLSDEISTVSKEVVGIKAQVSALDTRMTAMENGTSLPKTKSAGKGKPPVMRVDMSPRGADPFHAEGGDPWGGNDRRGIGSTDRGSGWTQWKPSWTENATSDNSNKNPRSLAPRVGDRKTLIIGGFPRDTGRADIEGALRAIVSGYEGVELVASMGRYDTCGRVEFEDNSLMWASSSLASARSLNSTV